MALFKKFLHLFLVREKKHLVFIEDRPIFKAIQEHNLDEVKKLLQQNSALIFEKDSTQENLLFYAIRQRASDIVRYLDTMNFSLATHTDELSNNVLHLVCQQNDETSAKYFMKRHPNLVYQQNKRGEYPDDLTTIYHLYQKLHHERIFGQTPINKQSEKRVINQFKHLEKEVLEHIKVKSHQKLGV